MTDMDHETFMRLALEQARFGLVAGEVRNQIVVPEPTRSNARVALERMLERQP